MIELGRLSERVVATREIPAREARTAPIPGFCPAPLRRALEERGLDRLWVHQAEMFERAERGEDVVITTATASGKTLGFLLPVLKAVHDDPAARVLLLYPTKALAHDQLRAVARLADELRAGPGGGQPLELGVYDGDTPPEERRRLRERANLVFTNPDMLNAGLLPAHGRPGYSHLLRNVRYVVIDEMHVYRGAFGAHFSNLMRRLLRVCRHYGSTPQFLCSSATIANPGELAETLCHRPFSLVDDDGSPSPGKVVHFWRPPMQDDRTRRDVGKEMAELLPLLVKQRYKTIAFCRGRKQTEIVLREARDRLASVDGGHDESSLLAAYRGGYTPEERRGVERDLISGRLLGVVSTNALELGIDIGQLGVVVQGGFPGTRASFWQQLGRAGRRGHEAEGILILGTNPIDQFIAGDPDWLLRQSAECAVVDADNLTVQLAHIRAAAAELPLSIDDVAWFPELGEVLPVLEEAGEVREVYGSWHWSGSPFPAGEFSMRETDGDRFKVVDRTTGHTLTEMTRPQVYREAHVRAVYLHGGVEYLVEELDLVGHRAVVVPVDQGFYTQPDVRTHIQVLVTQERKPVGRVEAWFGDVRVDDTVVGYKMLEFHNHQNLGYERLQEELSARLDTEAVWVRVPEAVQAALGEQRLDTLRGMVFALRTVAGLATMAERMDLRGTTFPFTDDEGVGTTALVLYDAHPGGLGFAAKGYEFVERLLREALTLVRECACEDGCPGCVGSARLSRKLIVWGFERLFAEVPLPPGVELQRAALGLGQERPGDEATEARRATSAGRCASAAEEEPPAASSRCDVPWGSLVERWDEVRAHLEQVSEVGAEFLRSLEGVEQRGRTLVLQVGGRGLVRWVGAAGPQEVLRELLEQQLVLPAGWKLEAELAEAREVAAARTERTLRRRYEDLVRGEAESEREANGKLSSGFLLRSGARREPGA